jgi:mRNA-degrading endonuclease RelE of RelBE toxin-antitoxin system
LHGKLKGHFRVRTGGFRVVVKAVGEEVWIVAVGNRKDIYED